MSVTLLSEQITTVVEEADGTTSLIETLIEGPKGDTGDTGPAGPAPSGTGVVKVASGVATVGTVDLGDLTALAANSIIGNSTGSAATPVALTVAQVNTLLGTATVAAGITQFPAFSSADLASELTDPTGTGAAVFATSPALVTPTVAGSNSTTPILTLTDTWNNAGTVYSGIRLNITRTNQNASSRFFDLQSNGTSITSVDANGAIINAAFAGTYSFIGNRTVNAPSYEVASSGTILFSDGAAYSVGLRASASGVLQVNSGTLGTLRDVSLRNLTASGTVTLGVFTVGTLPTAATNARARAFASDSNLAFNSTNLGSTVTAGGSNLVPVWCNGTNWVIG